MRARNQLHYLSSPPNAEPGGRDAGKELTAFISTTDEKQSGGSGSGGGGGGSLQSPLRFFSEMQSVTFPLRQPASATSKANR